MIGVMRPEKSWVAKFNGLANSDQKANLPGMYAIKVFAEGEEDQADD